jgi:EAL domain-containing protein (putative c-di-GMP-specific phosphodiesterase class I)
MMKKAIDSYNIVSYFQPIINNRTKQIEKYESLVRLIDEKGNILSPNFFLNVSKEGNYHSKITSIVLENSFKALKQTSVSIAINLSVLDIEKREIREKFLSLLQENQSDTQRIVLELTEEENIKNFKNIKEFIKKIKYLGVKIAIDDFGVGYSGFERVLDYKPDILKIDGRLIKNINKDKVTYSIVEAIVFFAKKEQLKTIAEYVENKAIYTTLCKLGIDYSQGYYFGKPKIL